jgi:hypothetical protein
MKLILILSVMLVTISGYSQRSGAKTDHPDSSVRCIARWKLGESKVYSIVHEKKTIGPAVKNSSFSFTYEAVITVMDSTANNYTIKWVNHLPDSFALRHPGLADSLPVYNGMAMIFKLTGTGAFVELLNWKEVLDAYSKMMDLSRRTEPDSMGVAIIKSAKDMFNSKGMVESLLIFEIRLFHLHYGYTFPIPETSGMSEVANPFGGDPFPAIQTWRISGLDPKKDAYTLAVNLTVDKANMNAIVDTLISKMNITDERKKKAARENYGSLDIHDISEYRYIRSSGWIRRLNYQRTVLAQGVTQTDTYTMTLRLGDTPGPTRASRALYQW